MVLTATMMDLHHNIGSAVRLGCVGCTGGHAFARGGGGVVLAQRAAFGEICLFIKYHVLHVARYSDFRSYTGEGRQWLSPRHMGGYG